MTSGPGFGRTWNFRYYDARGLITADAYPEGTLGRLDAVESAWRVAELFATENGITVTRIERQDLSGEWVEIPVLP